MKIEASFKNSKGEVDYILTEEIDKLILDSSKIYTVETNMGYEINFKLEDHNGNVVLIGTNENDNISFSENVDIQTFVDQTSVAAENRQLPDNTEHLSKLKKNLEYKFALRKIIDGVLFTKCTYKCLGFIISNGDKVATFDEFSLRSDSANENTVINISDAVSLIDINSIDNVFIDIFIDKKYKYELRIRNNNSVLEILNINKIDDPIITLDVLEARTKEEIGNDDEFIVERKRMLNINTSIDDFEIDDDLF